MQDASESFFARFRALDDEARAALAGRAQVDAPYEYRFDVEFPGRRYAVQGYPQEERVFVGQYLGERGVVWFDELRWEELQHGWRSGDRSAWDFFAGLADRPSLSHPEAEALAAQRRQSGAKEPPASREVAPARAPGLWATARQALRTVRRARRTLARVSTPWGAARTAVRLIRGKPLP